MTMTEVCQKLIDGSQTSVYSIHVKNMKWSIVCIDDSLQCSTHYFNYCNLPTHPLPLQTALLPHFIAMSELINVISAVLMPALFCPPRGLCFCSPGLRLSMDTQWKSQKRTLVLNITYSKWRLNFCLKQFSVKQHLDRYCLVIYFKVEHSTRYKSSENCFHTRIYVLWL